MEVLVLVGLVIYGGYRVIKSLTPAARKESKRQEEQHKQQIATNIAIREAKREEAITDYMNKHNVDRESAETHVIAEHERIERLMAGHMARQNMEARIRQETGDYNSY